LLIVGGLYLAAIVLPGMRPEWSQMRRTGPPAAESVPARNQNEQKGADHDRAA
jgi:hypothetical protein